MFLDLKRKRSDECFTGNKRLISKQWRPPRECEEGPYAVVSLPTLAQPPSTSVQIRRGKLAGIIEWFRSLNYNKAE